jgi:beta-ribofuranosylaminobenzene 5'-phosphate synthase
MGEKLVVVESTARLHFGIVNPFSRERRRFISVGLAIDAPRTRVVVEHHDKLSVVGCRAVEVYERIQRLSRRYGPLKGLVRIEECIPEHVGLGSTTQLLLAAATGLLTYNNIDFDVIEVARLMGLGRVSGVGTYAFMYGGFIVDTGVYEGRDFPKLLLRLDFPEEWAFILITPRGRGLDEAGEQIAFTTAPAVPQELPWKAAFVLFTRLIPAIIERNFEEFALALSDLQRTVGEMFSSLQGGIYSPWSTKYIELLLNMGVKGVGQSSWGPTVYGVVESLDEALEVAEKIKGLVDETTTIRVCRARNRGAIVRVLTHST